MGDILVAYATSEGQTARVAERLGETIADRGHTSTVLALADSDIGDVSAYDAVLLGASVHRGRHQDIVGDFVAANADALATRPTGLFQLSLASATEQGEEEAAGYVGQFLAETDWDPDRIGMFGGALRYSKYGFLKRLLMKQIAKRQLPAASTAADTEFTDWHEVEAFANDFVTFFEGRLGVHPTA